MFLLFWRFFFKPDAQADNDVPVANIRLDASDSILLNAPLAGCSMSLFSLSLWSEKGNETFYCDLLRYI